MQSIELKDGYRNVSSLSVMSDGSLVAAVSSLDEHAVLVCN